MLAGVGIFTITSIAMLKHTTIQVLCKYHSKYTTEGGANKLRLAGGNWNNDMGDYHTGATLGGIFASMRGYTVSSHERIGSQTISIMVQVIMRLRLLL